jgi:glucan phosphoethanolaminetransferase (alkaline phosphatase superfamily)
VRRSENGVKGLHATALAKVAASLVLLLATAGLLWHRQYNDGLWPQPGSPAARLPHWLTSAAGGWYPDLVETAANIASPLSLVAYLATWALCVASVFAVPFIHRTWLRVLLSALLLAGVTYDLVMFDIVGSMPPREVTETLLSNFHAGAEGTVATYAPQILRNLCLTLPLLLVFWLRPPFRPSWFPTVTLAATSVALAVVLWGSGGHATAFPSPVPSYINAYKSLRADEDEPLDKVEAQPALKSAFRKIVLVVDESVRGDYISLNDRTIGTTPFLLSREKEFANFGLAASLANCSIQSRLAMRFGVRDRELDVPWKLLRSRASIWQYAERAGFATVHIDAYGTAQLLVNGMTATERSHIDRRIIAHDTPLYLRDDRAAAALRELLREPGPMFILVDKFGAHIPYDRMYPPTADRFGAGQAGFSLEDRETLARQYRNAVAWSVDGFFAQLLDSGLPPGTLLLYTSDHGQSLSEGATTLSHCVSGAAATRTEVMVPMLALTDDADWKAGLAEAAAKNFGRTSHSAIFPTLLRAMGYAPDWLGAHFDPALGDRLAPGRVRHFWASGTVRPYDE